MSFFSDKSFTTITVLERVKVKEIYKEAIRGKPRTKENKKPSMPAIIKCPSETIKETLPIFFSLLISSSNPTKKRRKVTPMEEKVVINSLLATTLKNKGPNINPVAI
jgi:hypothetical protein